MMNPIKKQFKINQKWKKVGFFYSEPLRHKKQCVKISKRSDKFYSSYPEKKKPNLTDADRVIPLYNQKKPVWPFKCALKSTYIVSLLGLV